MHTLTEKLSAALLEISAKEDLVKQNAKVAEDAVSGICCLNILYFSFIWKTSFSSEKAIEALQSTLLILGLIVVFVQVLSLLWFIQKCMPIQRLF